MWFAFFSFVPLGSHGYVQNRTHPKGSLATLYFKDLCAHCYRGKGWVTKDKEASSFRHTVRAIHELGSVFFFFFFNHNFTLFFRKNLHEIIWTFDGFQSIFKGLSFSLSMSRKQCVWLQRYTWTTRFLLQRNGPWNVRALLDVRESYILSFTN